MSKLQKVDGLEGLRGYMALWVWMTHVVTMAQLPLHKNSGWGRWLANGDMAVGVFIILSGFVISASILRQPTSYTAYLTRRAFRLFPVYIVCLVLSILILDMSLSLMQSMPWEGTRTQGRIAYLEASKENFWPHLLLHIPLLHGLVPESVLPYTSYAFMGQAWSLTLEWQFYLVAPLLVSLASRLKWNFIVLTIPLLGLLPISFIFDQPSFLLSNLYLFYIGYLTYRLWYSEHIPIPPSTSQTAQSFLMIILITAAIVFSKGMKGISVLIWFIVILALQDRIGIFGNLLRRIVDNRLSRWLGLVSYDFYCVHMISIFICAYFLLEVLGVRSHLIYAAALIPLSLGVGFLLSWVLMLFVEKPMMGYGKRIAGR